MKNKERSEYIFLSPHLRGGGSSSVLFYMIFFHDSFFLFCLGKWGVK